MNRDKIGTQTCYVHQHTFVGTLTCGLVTNEESYKQLRTRTMNKPASNVLLAEQTC